MNMLTKIQKRKNTIKRERNIKRRKEIALKYRKSEAWRKSAMGRKIQAERAKEEATQMTPVVVEKVKEAVG